MINISDDELVNGTICPTCGRFAKKYRRKLISQVGTALIELYKLQKKYPERKWFHIKELSKLRYIGGYFAKARYLGWELIIQKMNDKYPAKRCNGMWGITARGEAFVENKLTIPKYVWTYGAKPISKEGHQISIIDVLGTHFNYGELMAGI